MADIIAMPPPRAPRPASHSRSAQRLQRRVRHFGLLVHSELGRLALDQPADHALVAELVDRLMRRAAGT